MKKVGLASDHAGFELKEFVKTWLTEKGYPCKDFGTYSTESCDYADYAHPLALAIEAGECGPGVAICACEIHFPLPVVYVFLGRRNYKEFP